ncbi:MAG: DUF4404 family protein [Gammaproteobacteria bacterium]|nr:DUF4404 family protein [Gammaproteobacteria bacterium]
MADKDLVFLLQDFERKLSDIDVDDSGVNAELKAARHQIRQMLSNPDKVPEPDEYLIDQLASIAEHFEAEHPTLSEWVSKLSDLFSRMGL